MKKENALFILGIIVILVAAGLMVEGSIFGDRTTVIAAVSAILGILMIGFGSRLRKGKSLF